jgi:hypothetical protein
MSATANGFRYPVSTDTPDVPRDVGYLAADVEAFLGQLVPGAASGAWNGYLPALSGTGLALGNGSSVGRYKKVGRTGWFRTVLTFGSTTTIGTVSQQIALPSGWSTPPGTGRTPLEARYVDASTGNEYVGQALIFDSGSTAFFSVVGSAGLFTPCNNTNPFGAAWATGDQVIISGKGIELAS